MKYFFKSLGKDNIPVHDQVKYSAFLTLVCKTGTWEK